MGDRIDQLAQLLLHKPFRDCTVEELQDFCTKYPYVNGAHHLLLKKQADTQAADGQGQQAALHAYAPFQVQQFLHPEAFDTAVEWSTLAPLPQPEVPEPIFEEEQTDAAEPQETPAPGLAQYEAEQLSEAEKENENKEATDEELPIAPLVMPQPVDQAPLGITFEPYHTVDYFASQGIKLSQTEAGNDQFGKQVKSFTEWLKTMKRLPAAQIASQVDSKGERKVENLAAHSLQKADIVTESMAEVWLKQGNLQKATEVYNKLSLLNPSKKAYFAAKIESLKKPY